VSLAISTRPLPLMVTTCTPAPATPDALQVHTRRVRCPPDPSAESSANSQGHWTKPPDAPERPVLFSQKHSLTSSQTGCADGILSASSASIRCALYTCASSRQCTGRSGPASGECFLVRTQLLQISHWHNRKYTLNFLKSANSRLASSVGGREEPKPLSTLGTPSPLQMC